MTAREAGRRRVGRWWVWALVALLVIVLAIAAVIAVPILTHRSAGTAVQQPSAEEWADVATAIGDDGRTRTIELSTPDGGEVDPSSLAIGDRVVVTGTGFDASRGIYVAVCVVPPSPADKPGPCVGDIPQEEQDAEAAEGQIQWAASNWINDDWAWRLFGARSYEDPASGAFLAYLEIVDPGEIDCVSQQCAIVTRNDHTALADRVQDVILPIRYATP